MAEVARKIVSPWFHRYPGRFPASVALEMLSRIGDALGSAPRVVLDPFVGTGTSVSCLTQQGVTAVGLEINPLALLICNVRFRLPGDVIRAGKDLLQLAAECSDERPEFMTGDAELVEWMGSANVAHLRALLSCVELESDDARKNWMHLAISNSLRAASVWLSGSIKPQRDPNRVPASFSDSLRRSVSALTRDSLLEPTPKSTVAVISADASIIPIQDGSLDAILTSPPYLTMYDYFDVQRLSFLAFGWERFSERQIGRQSRVTPDGVGFVPPSALRRWYRDVCRGEQSVEGRAIRLYCQRMEESIQEQVRVLKPGGVVCYAVADSIRRDGLVELTKAVTELLSLNGLSVVDVRRRATSHRRILPAGRDSKTGRFCSSSDALSVPEQIIVAKKILATT